MEGSNLVEIGQREIVLTLDGKKYAIKKPSALKLVDIHEAGKKINSDESVRELVLFQIQALVDLGLPKEVAEDLDISTLRECFTSLSGDPVKKK